MTYLTWLLSLIAAFYLGYNFRGLAKKVEVLEEAVKAKIDKPPIVEEPESLLIDPTDEVQTAIYEHNKEMERLNPRWAS